MTDLLRLVLGLVAFVAVTLMLALAFIDLFIRKPAAHPDTPHTVFYRHGNRWIAFTRDPAKDITKE